MAQSFLIFDFGTNEEAAQQARHKIESWKQAFRLTNKILLKFDRGEAAAKDASKPGGAEKSAGAKKKSAAKEENAEADLHIRLFVRLDFSDHEKLSHHRWLDRIPTEEPFKSARGEVVRHTDPSFSKTVDLFDSLD